MNISEKRYGNNVTVSDTLLLVSDSAVSALSAVLGVITKQQGGSDDQ